MAGAVRRAEGCPLVPFLFSSEGGCMNKVVSFPESMAEIVGIAIIAIVAIAVAKKVPFVKTLV